VACAVAPPLDVSGLRAAVTRAIVELQPTHPNDAAEIQSALTRAEATSAAEAAVAPWRRHGGQVEASWHHAAALAADRVVAARRRLQETRERYRSLEAEAASRLAAAGQMIETPGMGRSDARGLAVAASRLDNARRLAAAGDLEGAIIGARGAIAHLAAPEARWKALLERFEDPKLLRRWHQEATATVHESRDNGITSVVVDKLRRQLMLYRRGRLVLNIPVELGTNGLRPKLHSGDHATPEGRYRVVVKKEGHQTRYYKALLLDYPNDDDRRRFAAAVRSGLVPRGAGIGGLIEIHGRGGEGRDWTEGCVALSDEDMDLLYDRVNLGTPVTIVGTL